MPLESTETIDNPNSTAEMSTVKQVNGSVSTLQSAIEAFDKFQVFGDFKKLEKKATPLVLQETKTNAPLNLPPLHPISKMSLLNIPKNTAPPDSIKITENPDSAVITPIPKKDDSDTSSQAEKRKRTVSNILRPSGEKRLRKQDLLKYNQDSMSMDSGSTYNSDDGAEKKDSDDEVTLIKVVNSDPKKVVRRTSMTSVDDQANRTESLDRLEGKSIKDSSMPFDAKKIILWNDGVGSLPGSSIKFAMNDYGFMEVLAPEDSKKLENSKGHSVGDKENVYTSKTSSKSSSPTMDNGEKKDEIKKRIWSNEETFYCCEACGCHGTSYEFDSPISCSPACTEMIESMREQRKRREKDINKELRAKKKRKKLLQQQLSKERDKYLDNSMSLNDIDEKIKDNEEKLSKLDQTQEGGWKTDSDEDTKDTLFVEEESAEDSNYRHPWKKGKLGFSWSKYLEYTKSKAAPVNRFKDPFPYNKNNFKVGMKLEGIDPNHPSHFCVLTVAEVVGYRLRLHFDGYPETFDFWTNADSSEIFPCGWAEKNNHKLYPPKGYVPHNFNWNAYLKSCKAAAAPKSVFTVKNNAFPTTSFRSGMKLEAVDRKHSSLVCVASITDQMDSRILIHFDSWDDVYDYWADSASPYIHPVGWCKQNNVLLTPPNYYKDVKSFSWDAYLSQTNSVAAPTRAFKPRAPYGFKKGMKLEAVDKRLPQLVRVTTVEEVKDHMIKIKFDGWPDNHAYWIDDDSPDIHPMGWCHKTGHTLEPPLVLDNLADKPECGVIGCTGIGHVKGPKFASHNTASGCPYSAQNLNKVRSVPDRLTYKYDPADVEADAFDDKVKVERPERPSRTSSYDEKSVKQEDLDTYDRNDRVSRWKNNSDGLSDEEENLRKRKKRKLVLKDANASAVAVVDSVNMSEKQLRAELYQSVYNPGYYPLPDAPHVWAKHSSALNRVVAKQNTNPRRWSNEEVIKFIQSVPNCKDIGSIFRKHNIDGEAFLMLTQEDLVTILGLKLGPAIKLYNSIVLLRKRAS